MQKKRFFTYELWVSGEASPFYVGVTRPGAYRLYNHVAEARRGRRGLRYSKIRKAIAAGLEVQQRIVFESDDEAEAFAEEVRLIAHYGRRDLGTGCLANRSSGGAGTPGLSPKVIAAKKAKLIARPRRQLSAEFREKCRQRMLGSKHSPETRAKMSSSQKQRTFGPLSEEHRQKFSALRKGRPRHANAVRATAEANRGKRRSAEQIERLRQGALRRHAKARATALQKLQDEASSKVGHAEASSTS